MNALYLSLSTSLSDACSHACLWKPYDAILHSVSACVALFWSDPGSEYILGRIGFSRSVRSRRRRACGLRRVCYAVCRRRESAAATTATKGVPIWRTNSNQRAHTHSLHLCMRRLDSAAANKYIGYAVDMAAHNHLLDFIEHHIFARKIACILIAISKTELAYP